MRARFCLPLACAALSPLAFSQSSVFVGSSIVGADDPWFLIDVDAGAVVASGISARTEGCYGAAFHPLTGELVVTSLEEEEISSAPLVNGAPDFGTPSFQESLGGRPYRLRYDEPFERFFTVSNTIGGTQSSVYIVQGDPAAPNYGSKIDEVTVESIEGYTTSDDGTLFASVSLFFPGSFTMIDIDPSSGSYLQATVPAPTNVPGSPFGAATMISPDNRYVTILVPTFFETFVLKYDRTLATWVDTDPSTPGTQHFMVDIAFTMFMAQIPGTETAIVVGSDFGFNWVAKLDMTGPSTDWSLTQVSTFTGSPEALALSPDGSRFAVSTNTPARVLIGNSADGALTDEIVVPSDPINLITLAWSEDEVGSMYCDPAVPNSTGLPATIAAVGSAAASANNVEIVLGDLPANAFGFLITSRFEGFVSKPGGSQGNLCLGGAIGRYIRPGEIRQADASGVWTLGLDLAMTPQPSGFVAVLPGETWNYQAWYRDSVAGAATSNFSPGLSIDYR